MSPLALKTNHDGEPAAVDADRPIPLFTGLNQIDVAEILSCAEPLSAETKEILCRGGYRASRLFVLLKGRVKYSFITATGEEILLRLFLPGESIGLACLLPNPPNYLGTAEAVRESELACWSHDRILELSHRHGKIVTNALRIALLYLGRLADRHSALFDGHADVRIARALIDVGRRSGGINPDGIDIQITNEQLGSLADVSRFTVSRVMRDWSERGIVSKKRESVRIYSPEALLSH